MKKYILAVAVVMLVVAMAGMAMAATQTVAVSANVVGVCHFLTGGSVNFSLDPSIGGNVNGTITQPTFWCTRGTSWGITDDSGTHELAAGSRRMQHATSTTDFMPYSFTYTTTGTGSGPGTSINMDIASTVIAADYLNALAGDYADTVTLTILP